MALYFKLVIMNYTKTIQINAPVEQVFQFCTSPDGFEKHFPHSVQWISTEKNWCSGSIIEFKFFFYQCGYIGKQK